VDSVYVCSNCRYESPFYLAECPGCGQGFFNLKGAAPPAPAAGYAATAPPPRGELRICYKCDYETREGADRCPRCGHKRVMTQTAVRALGGVLVAVGLFLVLFMGAIAVIVAGIIARSNAPGATTRFEGGTKEIVVIFGIFGLVIAFGATSVVAGAMQLARGRRSKTMVRVILGIFIALVVAAELVYIILD